MTKGGRGYKPPANQDAARQRREGGRGQASGRGSAGSGSGSEQRTGRQSANNNASTTSTVWSGGVPAAVRTADDATSSGGRGSRRDAAKTPSWKEQVGEIPGQHVGGITTGPSTMTVVHASMAALSDRTITYPPEIRSSMEDTVIKAGYKPPAGGTNPPETPAEEGGQGAEPTQQAEGSSVPEDPPLPDQPSVPDPLPVLEQPPGTVEDDLFLTLRDRVNELATASSGHKRALTELQGSVTVVQERVAGIKHKVAKLSADVDVSGDGIAAVQDLVNGAIPQPEEAMP